MVAVTATNDNDVRTFSGYGATNDLGAPGDILPASRPQVRRHFGPAHVLRVALRWCTARLARISALTSPQATVDAVRGYISMALTPSRTWW